MFYDFKNSFKVSILNKLDYPDRVPAKVIQKLQILRASIDNKPLGKVDLLSEEEK